jgi:Ni/Co efflux regulator RcnB
MWGRAPFWEFGLVIRTIFLGAVALAGMASATPAAAQRVWQNGQWTQMSPRGGQVPQMHVPPMQSAQMQVPPRQIQGAPRAQYQQPNRSYPGASRPQYQQPIRQVAPRPNTPRGNNPRWGGQVNGRWYAGVYAPGGWNAYRRPTRGWSLPSYWFAPSFYITDYSNWGLSAPRSGYNWVRYYDDAVLVDSRGRVEDYSYDLDWDRGDAGYSDGYGYQDYESDGGAYAHSESYVQGGGYGAGYAQPGYVEQQTYQGYPGGYAPPVTYAPPVAQQSHGSTTYYQNGYAGGYAAGGYAYGPTTTVTVYSAPVETTVTETIVEETVSYAAPVRTVRRAAPKRKWKPRPKPRPVCSCACACQ